MAVKSKKLEKTFKFGLNPNRIAFFALGALLGTVFLLLFFFCVFEINFQNKIYPNISVGGIPFGGKSYQEVASYFNSQNNQFVNLTYSFKYPDNEGKIATLSGQDLKIKIDGNLLAVQAFLIGRNQNFFSSILEQFSKRDLPLIYTYDNQTLNKFLQKLSQDIDVPAEDALFKFENGKVSAFKLSKDGKALDQIKVKTDFLKLTNPPKEGVIFLETKVVPPKIKNDQANNLGINELLGEGKSYFVGSIANRIFNISLAASKINGIIIPPQGVFSFNNTVGEISAKTGYQQAYIIKEKRTVLDDGGGVCQVSTTLFRAALEAGLPIVERNAHAYRVGYYEQGGFGPGMDATVYNPSVDFKFKNDTPASILIQSQFDDQTLSLVFDFYGTYDQRKVTLGKPKITDITPPPPDLYQDDPTLPKGQVKQVDFPAWGGKASFEFNVIRNGETLENQTFYSNYQPWQAIFLKGTL